LKNLLNNKPSLFVLAALLFVAAHFLHHPIVNKASYTVADFEKTLHKKEERLNAAMLNLAKLAEKKNYTELFIQKPSAYNTLLEQEGLALLIYENDSLKFWSDNSIAFENWMKEVCLDTKMVKLRNGWFEVMKPKSNASTTKTVVGLVLIKNEYPYQNKYLVNEFQKDFAVPAETKLIANTPNSANQVKNQTNEYLFSLAFNAANNSIGLHSYFALIFNLLAFFFVIVFLKRLSETLQTAIGNNTSLFLFIISVFILRYLTLKFSFPGIFYDFELFNPKVYADASSMWLSSLGDLLINTILLFLISYFIINEYSLEKILTRFKSLNKIGLSLILLLGFFWFSWMITTLFYGLIINSDIPFSINNLFSTNRYTYIALVVVGLMLFVYFWFSDKLVTALKLFHLEKRQYIIVFLIAASIHVIILQLRCTLDLIVIFWPFVIIITIALIKRKQTTYPFSGIVFLVFLFSLYATHIFIKHTGIKEMESRKIFAEKLAAEQDPVAEFLYQDIEKKISTDSILISYVNKAQKQKLAFEKRLKQEYFSGFWEKYDLRIALFDSLCMPIIKSPNPLYDNNLYFDELIEKKGIPTSCEHFSFINSPSGKASYVIKLPLTKSIRTTVRLGTLYIELAAKFISDEIGFPELLLDRNMTLSQELSNYSYAKYKNNQLVSQYGKFPYNLSASSFDTKVGNYSFVNKENYNHLLYRPDSNTLIILSKRESGLVGRITMFSYLFAFFSILLLSISFIRQASSGGSLFENFSFKYRIQLFLVFIVLISLALFGGGTIYYINQQFETKNRENISEKINSVLMEMQTKSIEERELSKDLSEYITFVLKRLSNIFFTDINLYDTDGNLYASSRPDIFDEGLTSKKMNPEAFLQIAVFEKTEFIHDERIGKLEYLSAYIPFKNKDGKLIAYLNLPYFAKQNELEKEISGFLVALINIYVLLFALSIVTAIFISNYVTKPLKLIQDKLSKIKLGTTNELIEWQEQDEIGNLVSEYNRMILELAKSAELLAKSERESAWREMAKQVAHEIKNPLTPMKLSVQHLKRIWKDQAPDMDERMERLTLTIIEQIDTLSTIATEFSNFAKMPKANLEKINVQQILLNSIALFHDSENIDIDFKNQSLSDTLVLADKEQLLRVFNNLIKNAIQAIPEDRKGKIEIDLTMENQCYIISIKDNGIGINDDVLDKIFVPNFTTKTAGMGLGLAMVKSIVESFNGKIWFETKIDEGSTFYVSLPCDSNA
jgi:two-component system nitrogen regulation sensor histidine kinase NtrY